MLIYFWVRKPWVVAPRWIDIAMTSKDAEASARSSLVRESMDRMRNCIHLGTAFILEAVKKHYKMSWGEHVILPSRIKAVAANGWGNVQYFLSWFTWARGMVMVP